MYVYVYLRVRVSVRVSTVLQVIVRHGEPAARLCNKDPLMLKMGTYVLELFPNARFVFMVRDGRATVHSMITRKVTITGFDLTSYRQCLGRWNHAAEAMYQQCRALGEARCLLVRYEALVLRPEATLRAVLAFLDLPWSEAVLHHERYINQPHGVALSQVERSSDQVVRPVNRDALDKWVGALPADVRADMAEIAPMLSVLGYDPWANPPRYDLQPPPEHPAHSHAHAHAHDHAAPAAHAHRPP